MLASVIFETVLSIQEGQRMKQVSIRCTDKRVEILTIAEMVEGTPDRIRKCPQQQELTKSPGPNNRSETYFYTGGDVLCTEQCGVTVCACRTCRISKTPQMYDAGLGCLIRT